MYVMCYLSRQYSKNYKPFLDDEKPEKIILTEVTCEKIPKMRRSEINATSGEITIGNTQEITDKEKLHNTIQKIFYSMSEKDIIFFQG